MFEWPTAADSLMYSEKGLNKKEDYHRAGKLYGEINRYSRKFFTLHGR